MMANWTNVTKNTDGTISVFTQAGTLIATRTESRDGNLAVNTGAFIYYFTCVSKLDEWARTFGAKPVYEKFSHW